MSVIGTLAVNVVARTTQFMKGMNDASKATKNFNNAMALLKMGAAADVFQRIINHASGVQESLNRTRAIFKDSAKEMIAWSQQLGNQLGRSSVEISSAASNFAQMAKGIGMTTAEAIKLSKAITKAGIDFASFNNISDAEAFQRIRSMLSGSAEVMDQFGVNTRMNALGLSPQASEMDKFRRRFEVFMEAMNRQGAMDDATKTAENYANQMKRLNAEMSKAVALIGTELLPSVTLVVKRLGEMPGRLRDLGNLITAPFKRGKAEAAAMPGRAGREYSRFADRTPKARYSARSPFMSGSSLDYMDPEIVRRRAAAAAIKAEKERQEAARIAEEKRYQKAQARWQTNKPMPDSAFNQFWGPQFSKPGSTDGSMLNMGSMMLSMIAAQGRARPSEQLSSGLAGVMEAGGGSDIRARAGRQQTKSLKVIEDNSNRQVDLLQAVANAMKPDTITGFSATGSTAFGAP